MYESATRLAAEVSRDVEEFFQAHTAHQGVWCGAKFFKTRIRRNIRLAEAPSFGQSIFQYAPTSNGTEDYLSLAYETLGEEAPTEEGEVTAYRVATASAASTNVPA